MQKGNSRPAISLLKSRSLSVQVEADLQAHFHCHRPAIFLAGIKLPELHNLQRTFIKSHSKCADHASIVYATISTNNRAQNHNALILRFSGFFSEFRFRSVNGLWSAYAVAYMEDSRTYAGTAVACTHTPAVTAADSAGYTSSIGSNHKLGEWIADLRRSGVLKVCGNYRGLNHELALLGLNHYGRRKLLLGYARRGTRRSLQLARIATTAATAIVANMFRDIRRQVD